ncbi:phospholipase D-like domain-containing protein [Bacillus suaedaesalsae]|uniref:phospholipase D n=1 Tax=Bacillus suaedaesalsae TaxID=2810349 RepID=A0ABS2DH63_9BACI|nr:phospholipase D-like domain-containing protein [Bacillus suaedaesalsae]MBM6617829.1 lamin tail domain-containing protein [Bacillus suaedaesalsae]
MKRTTQLLSVSLLFFSLLLPLFQSLKVNANLLSGVTINEIAWMGTTISYSDEWMELYNDSSQDVDLTGWTLTAQDGSPSVNLQGVIPAKGYYLLEKTDDSAVEGITADLIYTGSLSNTSEILELRDAKGNLVDQVNGWYFGDNTTKATMERINPSISGTEPTNWNTATSDYGYGYGSPKTRNSNSSYLKEVVVNEIAWMGTLNSYSDEWIELYNNSSQDLSLDGWQLKATDGDPVLSLTGTIPAHGYFLLERTDDNSVTSKSADYIYSGTLGNTSEILTLTDHSGVVIDTVDAWYSGDNDKKATMERVDSNESGTISSNWATAIQAYADGVGTPKGMNSTVSDGSGSTDESGTDVSPPSSTTNSCTDTTERINNVSEAVGAINIYFNKCALTEYALPGNAANYNVNFENILINRLNAATSSIDFATYEINLPRVVDTLVERAADGIDVRVIADAKDSADPHYAERYETMRLYIEKMVRGQDKVIGTADDIVVLSDSPMLAVEDSTKRTSFGLPASPSDINEVTVEIGSNIVTGRLFVDAEVKSTNSYYGPTNQMHNKFAIVDNQWVFTGTWNFTVTGLYGTDENMNQGILDGNQNQIVEINWPDLASIYNTEFNEMWGSNTLIPDPIQSNFSTRKIDNTPHVVDINGKKVEVYFSAGDNALGRMTELVKNEAQLNAYFSIFAWSDQSLVDELKYKWENSYNDLEGTLTGFDIKGIFDSSFWNQWWSASIDMTGRTASQTSLGNPNTRWANPAPVYQDTEVRKLHSKTMLIDADTTSDPTVIVGSTNWSNNGNNVNDENMLIIHDAAITNQFYQEFSARYMQAGGSIE